MQETGAEGDVLDQFPPFYSSSLSLSMTLNGRMGVKGRGHNHSRGLAADQFGSPYLSSWFWGFSIVEEASSHPL